MEIDKTVYSTTEKRVGTWIDGKPLYRKTYTQSNSNAINLTTLSVDKLFIVGETNAKTSAGTVVPLPYPNINLYYTAPNLTFEIYGFTLVEVIITIEYTKTTD